MRILNAVRGGFRRPYLLLLALLSSLVLLSTACYQIGAENSWMRVQNMGGAPANVEVQYFDANGKMVASERSLPIQPGAGWTFSQKDNPMLPLGFLGSAVVISDQPIAVLMAKDVDKGGGVYQAAGETVALNAGSDKLYLPNILNRDGFNQDWNSRFVIQNMGDQTACATLVYMSNKTDAEEYWDPYNPSTSNPKRLADCPNGGMPIPANGSLVRSWSTMGVGPGFSGSVRVELHRNAQKVPPSQQYIVATADIFNFNSKQFASYRGLTTSDMGTSLFVPLVEREAGGEWSTDFQIVNSDPTKPATVNLRFEGWDGSVNPPQFIVKESQITVRAARSCYQNSDWFNCLSPGDTLPHNFVDGTVRVNSTQPIGIVASRGSSRSDTYVNYRAVKTDEAGRKVYLPLVNRNAITGWTRNGLMSWIRVVVADGGQANLTVHYYGPGLAGGEAAYTIPIYRTFTIVQTLDPALPDGFIGSAVLESDRPIVALGDVVAGSFAGDPDIMYNGVPGS
jgi:hypothetical protein